MFSTKNFFVCLLAASFAAATFSLVAGDIDYRYEVCNQFNNNNDYNSCDDCCYNEGSGIDEGEFNHGGYCVCLPFGTNENYDDYDHYDDGEHHNDYDDVEDEMEDDVEDEEIRSTICSENVFEFFADSCYDCCVGIHNRYVDEDESIEFNTCICGERQYNDDWIDEDDWNEGNNYLDDEGYFEGEHFDHDD